MMNKYESRAVCGRERARFSLFVTKSSACQAGKSPNPRNPLYLMKFTSMDKVSNLNRTINYASAQFWLFFSKMHSCDNPIAYAQVLLPMNFRLWQHIIRQHVFEAKLNGFSNELE